MSGSFTFKQFTIDQDQCAMKVGTDGVLLGAWADGGERILDIGMGTGLISLMMAQRFPHAHVDGVEIDPMATRQAQSNIRRSPFSDRIAVACQAIQQYEAEPYDVIVSNPPFFNRSLLTPQEARTQARHTTTLSYRDLFHHAWRLAKATALLYIIVPTMLVDDFVTEAAFVGWNLHTQTDVRTTHTKPPKRSLLCFGKTIIASPTHLTQTMMQDGQPTKWYRLLTEAFYLNL